MMEKPEHRGRSTAPPSGDRSPALSPADKERLDGYKWRYALELRGFTAEQADRLLFARWLYRRRAAGGQPRRC